MKVRNQIIIQFKNSTERGKICEVSQSHGIFSIIILKNQNMSQFISNKIKEEKDNLLILTLEF